MTEIKNTNEIKFSTKYSTSYKHSLVIGTFAIAFMINPIAEVKGTSGKNLCIKYLKQQTNREKLIKILKIVKQANPSSICDSILKS